MYKPTLTGLYSLHIPHLYFFLGGANRIERVYFEIKESTIDQWEKPQIKVRQIIFLKMIVYVFEFIDYYITFFFFNQESKRAFFYSIVTEGGDKGKLEAFVNFCEDAIFEVITLIAQTDDMTSL